MICHLVRMLLTGMEGADLELLTFRKGDRYAVLTAATDDGARQIAEGFGVELTERSSAATTWLSAGIEIEGVDLVITGPMRKRAALEVVS